MLKILVNPKVVQLKAACVCLSLKYDEFRGVEAATWGHCCLDSLITV